MFKRSRSCPQVPTIVEEIHVFRPETELPKKPSEPARRLEFLSQLNFFSVGNGDRSTRSTGRDAYLN